MAVIRPKSWIIGIGEKSNTMNPIEVVKALINKATPVVDNDALSASQ